jgi:RNA-directed DNA polymerase
VLSPLIFNIAMAGLDEHLMAPWKPGGDMATGNRRTARRRNGLPTWRMVRYADDFAVLVHGQRGDAEALREVTARVLEPLGLRLSPAKTRIVRVPRAQEGEVAM